MLREASTLYTNALNWPDARVGWLPYAWGAGRRLLGGWRPDLVYASSPPPTCLVVGKLLAAHCGVPWIAEFRDRWSDDPYYAQAVLAAGVGGPPGAPDRRISASHRHRVAAVGGALR